MPGPDNPLTANINPGVFNWAALNGREGLVTKALERAAGRVRDRTKRNITTKGRVNNGRMRQSVDYKIHPSPDNALERTATVGIYVRYAAWQEGGTRGPIYPTHAKVLRFKPKGGGAFIYAKKVKGVKPGHFLRDAVRSLTADDFTAH